MDLDFAATAKPFTGVVLCCTGVDHEERVRFFGGSHLSLTLVRLNSSTLLCKWALFSKQIYGPM
jgi:hypothetical protein